MVVGRLRRLDSLGTVFEDVRSGSRLLTDPPKQWVSEYFNGTRGGANHIPEAITISGIELPDDVLLRFPPKLGGFETSSMRRR